MRLGGYFAVGGSKKSEGNKKNTPADKDKSRNVSFCLHRRQTFRGLRVKMAQCSALFAKKNQICRIRH